MRLRDIGQIYSGSSNALVLEPVSWSAWPSILGCSQVDVRAAFFHPEVKDPEAA